MILLSIAVFYNDKWQEYQISLFYSVLVCLVVFVWILLVSLTCICRIILIILKNPRT